MNEFKKIGMYSTDEILEFMTEGEGRGFLGRSMFDAMYFKINNLQSKIDKVNLFKSFLQERLLELKDNIERGVADFDARDECEYILEQFIYFLEEDK